MFASCGNVDQLCADMTTSSWLISDEAGIWETAHRTGVKSVLRAILVLAVACLGHVTAALGWCLDRITADLHNCSCIEKSARHVPSVSMCMHRPNTTGRSH